MWHIIGYCHKLGSHDWVNRLWESLVGSMSLGLVPICGTGVQFPGGGSSDQIKIPALSGEWGGTPLKSGPVGKQGETLSEPKLAGPGHQTLLYPLWERKHRAR
jgi:hypothetical protein